MVEESPDSQPPDLAHTAKSCPLLDEQSDREAWVACCTKRFLPIARRIAGGDALAEDALQESWIRVLKHVCKYRGDSPACSWVGVVVANCAKDIRAKEPINADGTAASASTSIADPRQNPEVVTSERELLAWLHAVVDALPDKHREVYEMRYIRDLSTSETAHELGISKSAVATRLKRAVSNVKRVLAKRLRDRDVRHSSASAVRHRL